MNIADQIYTTMYNIIVVKLLPSLTQLIINLNSTGFFKQITIISVMVIGLLMIYGKMNRVTFVKSFITIFIVYSLFVSVPGNIYLLESLRSLFVDGPIKYGSYLVNTISSVIYQGTTITQQTINIEPGVGSTAFGKLWQISTDLASAVWDAGGLSDIGAFFIGFALYGVAVFLLVAQILMLGTFLIMSAAAIFSAPLFIPMVLFNSTRQMFQSWFGFGLSGAFGLIMLMIMMGIIFGFVSITFMQVFGIDLSTGEVGDIDDISDMGKIGAMVVFMLISIKLLPKIEMWASSLAGASAAGISDASMAVGAQIGKATGLTAKATGKQLNKHSVKPVAGAVKRGLGRVVDRFRNRSAKSNTTSKPNDTKQKLANSKLKNSIRNRLVARGQDQKRPLAQLNKKEQSIQKRQTIQHTKSQSAQSAQSAQGLSPKPNHYQNNGTSSGDHKAPTIQNKNVKQSGKSESTNKSSESQKKESSSKNTSAAQRPLVKSDSSNSSTEKQKAEKTTTTKTETQVQSPTSVSNKTSIAGSQKSSKTNTTNTNTSLSQKTSNTSSQRSKPIDRIDRNSKIKEKKARETHRKHLDALQTEQETKRRETSKKPIKKKKKGDDE